MLLKRDQIIIYDLGLLICLSCKILNPRSIFSLNEPLTTIKAESWTLSFLCMAPSPRLLPHPKFSVSSKFCFALFLVLSFLQEGNWLLLSLANSLYHLRDFPFKFRSFEWFVKNWLKSMWFPNRYLCQLINYLEIET